MASHGSINLPASARTQTAVLGFGSFSPGALIRVRLRAVRARRPISDSLMVPRVAEVASCDLLKLDRMPLFEIPSDDPRWHSESCHQWSTGANAWVFHGPGPQAFPPPSPPLDFD